MIKECENCGFNHKVGSNPYKACQKVINSKKAKKKTVKKAGKRAGKSDWFDKPENKVKVYIGIAIAVLAVIVMVVNRL